MLVLLLVNNRLYDVFLFSRRACNAPGSFWLTYFILNVFGSLSSIVLFIVLTMFNC